MLSKIKAAQLQARKNREALKAAALTTLIGEAETVGKNNGNRAPTDTEVTALIKKFIKNLDEVIAVVNPASDGYHNAVTEKELFSSFLPKQLNEDELKVVIATIIAAGAANMGEAMKQLKAQYAGLYDGGLASKLLKESLK